MLAALLFRMIRFLPPETAHAVGIWALKHDLIPEPVEVTYSVLTQRLWDRTFSNPLGLAAGFDKQGEAVRSLFAQGFGFLEVGTVTPQAQPGNDRPRVFRLAEDQAVINRYGFNSDGASTVCERLREERARGALPGPLWVNIGKNKHTTVAEADYLTVMNQCYELADGIVVNVSSPNTPGLRDLQDRKELDNLLMLLMKERNALAKAHGKTVPLLLKIAPDISQTTKHDIAELALFHEIDGIIATNTTTARPDTLQSIHAKEAGGLSGAPLMEWSTCILSDMYKLTEGKIPLVGVGGVADGADAYRKIRAGASLVELYTALVYQGFGVVERIKEELAEQLAQDGFAHISDAIGADHRQESQEEAPSEAELKETQSSSVEQATAAVSKHDQSAA